MGATVPRLPTPHLDKLRMLLRNRRLPSAYKPRVEEAIKQYHQWIRALESVRQDRRRSLRRVGEATNQYKKFIELDLIFDSSESFLYRQKGQLKLDNTILEEFLPQLVFRGVRLGEITFELGPRKSRWI